MRELSPLLTLPQAAEMLLIKPKRLYERWKTLPPGVVLKVGWQLRFHRKRLEAWMARGGDLRR